MRAVGFVALSVMATGCFQIDTHVRYHEDGSATITERVNLSRRLLDMSKGSPSIPDINRYLDREYVLKRMELMGKGIQLVNHAVREGERGSREAVAVYKIPDLNDFHYPSPYLSYADYPVNNVIRWRVVPMYKSRPYGQGSAGCLSIDFAHVKKKLPKGVSGALPAIQAASPLNEQVFRELSPVFRDMLRDLRIKIAFESYCPVSYKLNSRGRSARVHAVDLINVTDRDLDTAGYNFFENEEVMLDLVRGDWGSPDVAGQLKAYNANPTLPVVTPLGSKHMWWTGGRNLHFRPSRQLFDRYFKGKKLDFSQWQASPPSKHVPATWERIGYKPPRKEKKSTQ